MTAESKEELVEGFRVHSIQDAAMRVIARKGPGAATMQDIADEAGIAKGTIYLYFRNREEVLEKTAESAFAELLSRLQTVLAEPGSLPDRLRALVRTKIEYFDAHQEFFRVYMAMRYPDGVCSGERRKRRAERPQFSRYIERLTGFLSEAARRGEAKPLEPSRVALFLAEGVSAILVHRLSETPPPTREDEVEWIVELMLRGLSTEAP
jgi:AcrR family transcriptional regulator